MQCVDCSRGELSRFSFQRKNIVSTTTPLQLLHMDLCGLMRIQSYDDNRYVYMIIDEFIRYTWIVFLNSKHKEYDAFSSLIPLFENGPNQGAIHQIEQWFGVCEL